MRVIAGRLGGRAFAAPRGHRTHPMSEKGRGALFNALGDVSGLTVLDAFAGSGALGFEALSRGASHVTAIEHDRNAQITIADNVRSLNIEDIKLIKANAAGWLSTARDTFDLVLLDPPYDDLQPALLAKLADRAVRGGTVVMSLPPGTDAELPADKFKQLARKNYGDAELVFYRKTG